MANHSISPVITTVSLLISLLPALTSVRASIGVCYGRLGDNLPPPPGVVALLKSKGLSTLRIYDADAGVLDAVSGSGIDLIIGVVNNDLPTYAASPSAALDWVKSSIASRAGQLSVRYVVVGNEVIPGDLAPHVLPAMRNIQAAIDSVVGLQGRVKVSTSVSMAVLGTSFPPSAGDFAPGPAAEVMVPVVQYLASIDAPLLLNVYPYFAYRDSSGAIALDYALFTSPSVVVQDGEFQYRNLFDAMVDSVNAAMEKKGAAKVRIVVSESGWPSAGDVGASVENAQKYNQNLIEHVGQGTPRRPGAAVETFIFAVFNENQKQPELEKHWGLFNPDMSPSYPIRFS